MQSQSEQQDGMHRIKQLPSGKSSFDIKSKMNKVTNWITKNQLLVQIDFFYTQVKFLVNGQDNFRTKFGGCMSILMLVLVTVLTYKLVWPSELKSQITLTEMISDTIQTQYGLCQNTQYPISFAFRRITLLPLTGNAIFPQQFKLHAYYFTKTANITNKKQIQLSKNCLYDNNLCINCKQIDDQLLQIYGGGTNDKSTSGNITFEMQWCDTTNPSCPEPNNYYLNISFQNNRKLKSKSLQLYTIYKQINLISLDNFYNTFSFQVTKQTYTSNSKFFGHLSNILPWSTQLYQFQEIVNNQLVSRTGHQTLTQPNQNLQFIINFSYSGKLSKYKQQFIDISLSIVFFLALLDPVRLVIVQILLKWYNKNARDLYIANKLFYIQDPQNDQKYDFNSGIAVFFACLIHRHPLTGAIKLVLACFGYNLVDVVSNKCIYTIAMINQGDMLMRQQQFFKMLQSLSAIDNTQNKKQPLFINKNQQQDQQQQQQQQQLTYYKNDPIKRQAFHRFCKDNQYYSNKRKNKVYQMLIDKKYSTRLKSNAHRIYKSYVSNVENLRDKGKFLETFHDGDEIPVDMVKQKFNDDQLVCCDGTEMELRMSAFQRVKNI